MLSNAQLGFRKKSLHRRCSLCAAEFNRAINRVKFKNEFSNFVEIVVGLRQVKTHSPTFSPNLSKTSNHFCTR
jgi:hypothetical protein